MPFKSKAQMKYMFAKHPKIAKEWADKYGVPKKMPEHAGKRREQEHKKMVNEVHRRMKGK